MSENRELLYFLLLKISFSLMLRVAGVARSILMLEHAVTIASKPKHVAQTGKCPKEILFCLIASL